MQTKAISNQYQVEEQSKDVNETEACQYSTTIKSKVS